MGSARSGDSRHEIPSNELSKVPLSDRASGSRVIGDASITKKCVCVCNCWSRYRSKVASLRDGFSGSIIGMSG